MLNTIKNIILIKSIVEAVPFVISTSYLAYDITTTVIKWSTSDIKIDSCKCIVCEDYRKRFGREPSPH